MKYATANAFRTALEQRLLTTSLESGIKLAQLRKLVVFERFLARLIAVAPDRWVLKGAVALYYRVGSADLRRDYSRPGTDVATSGGPRW